jgi:hypothetical protein
MTRKRAATLIGSASSLDRIMRDAGATDDAEDPSRHAA